MKREAKEIELAFDEKYITYLEENDDVLLGWNAPLFIAKLDSSGNNSKIHYRKVPFVSFTDQILFYYLF